MRASCGRPAGIVQEAFEDEVVIINLDSATYDSLNGTRVAVWTILEGGTSLDDVVAAVAAGYDADTTRIESDVRGLIERLLAEQLVCQEAARGRGTAIVPGEGERRPYAPPSYEWDGGAERAMTSSAREACAAALGFFESANSSFAQATDRAGALRRLVAVDGRVVCLVFAGEALVPLLFPALGHLSVDPAETPALNVHLFDTETTGTPMPPAPWGRDAYLPRGEIAGFNNGRIRTVYQPGTDALNVYDRQRRLGLYWVRRPADVAYWETGAPLRAILHWWLEDGDLQLVHAGAVGYPTGGVLLGGRGGSGKSTSTLACLESDLLYAGDDYVAVSTAEPACVHSLYQTAKVDPGNLGRLSHLRAFVHNPDRLDTEKAVIFPGRGYPDRLTRGFPIKALLVPRVTGRVDTRLVPSRPGLGLSALAPTTVFQLPGNARRVFAKIATLVQKVPTFILEAGTDLRQIPEVVGLFLRGRA